jgi:hypothetical protein
LAEEGSDDAGEHVAGAAGGHAGVAGLVEGELRAVGNHSVVAFEDDDDLGGVLGRSPAR